MDRLSYKEDDDQPWVKPNDDLPENLEIVDVITTDDYITVAQFHVGIVKIQSDGTPKVTRRPCFGFINPDDLNLKVTIKAWRHLI